MIQLRPPNLTQHGPHMHALLRDLFPLHRAVTGTGLRQTFARLQQEVPLTVTEVPTGTQVFDWTVPNEWRIDDAYIADSDGRRIVDYRQSNLHVVGYSQPVNRRMTWAELDSHVHSIPEQPDWIPYRTSFYTDAWGVCLPHRLREELSLHPEAEYEVVIEAEHFAGSLSFAELYLPGESSEECLIYAHTCHPSLANDNLTGVVVATWLAKLLQERPRRLSYRFVFAPATIGAITWLASRKDALLNIKHGLVLTLLGDAAPLAYKQTRDGDAEIDRVVRHLLQERGIAERVETFRPMGYDERQFGSPGFNLPVGRLMRSDYGSFAEYHSSGDSPDFVQADQLADSLSFCVDVVDALDGNQTFLNCSPFGEPQLGRRGIYDAINASSNRSDMQQAVLWVLNQSDGQHDLLTIAQKSGLLLETIQRAAALLREHSLIQASSESSFDN